MGYLLTSEKHSIQLIIKKLEYYGGWGTLPDWFRSYLIGRKQYVFHNGESSDLKPIHTYIYIHIYIYIYIVWCPTGLSFGSVTLFTLHYGLPNISTKLKFFLFADDTNIYFESHDSKYKELKKLYLWLNINRLSLNANKRII